MKQYISFGPSAGICNRIKRFFSALRFNVNWNEPLDFYWSQGELTDHSFKELFNFELFDVNERFCEEKINLSDSIDVAIDNGWRLLVKEGELPKGFTRAYKKDDENKEYIDFEYGRIPQEVREEYLRYFNALKPAIDVKKRIAEVVLPQNCVCVHVRQGRFWNEYNRGNREGYQDFVDVMRGYSKDTKFFLAAADEIVSNKIRREFPDQIIELPNKSYSDSIDAVAELYLLGQGKELIGTYGSTFSEVAWWLGGCKQSVKIIGGENDWKMQCPVCKEESAFVREYSRENCMNMYRHLYSEVPGNLEIVDYNIHQCKKCGLVFSNPMKGGSQSFYTWVTSHDNYYPTKESPRWEWQEIREYIKKNKIASLLEVGCGTGEFLDYLKDEVAIKAVGLDTTTSSYEKCIEKGLDVHNISLERYILDNHNKYDLVVAFHLLEHVENPQELVADMMKLLNEGGQCMLSFPYSDTRLDKCFTTANNMPPHHLTRWELPAIKVLAKSVDAELEVIGPEANTVEADIYNDLRNEFFPIYENANVSKARLRFELLKHWKRGRDIIQAQKTRKDIPMAYHIGGEIEIRRAPWFVLIVLKKR